MPLQRLETPDHHLAASALKSPVLAKSGFTLWNKIICTFDAHFAAVISLLPAPDGFTIPRGEGRPGGVAVGTVSRPSPTRRVGADRHPAKNRLLG
jgi:hypothetical protein